MIRKSTLKDLLEIESWLKRESKDEEGSFWSDINLIRKAHEERQLYVLIDSPSKKAVAFIFGSDTIIHRLAVKKDQRRKGYGKVLAEYYLNMLWKKGSTGVRIECNPPESASFWEKMGFKLDPSCSLESHDYYMYITHQRQKEVSNLDNIKTVEIELFDHYPETVLVEPVCIFAEEKNRKLLLSKEYVQFLPQWPSPMVLSISVDGKQVHLDYALDSNESVLKRNCPFLSIWEINLSKVRINSKID